MREKQLAQNNPEQTTFSSNDSSNQSELTASISDEWLSLALEVSDTYWWETDLLTQQTRYSSNAERILGKAPAPNLKDNLAYLHPEDRSIPEETFAQSIQTGTDQFHYQVRSIAIPDQVRWFQITGKIFRNEQGEPVLSVGSAQNITFSKLAQQGLRQSEAWLAGQKEAFQASLTGSSLEESLNVLVRTAVEQLGANSQCAFYIIDSTGTGLRLVTGMSEAYARFVNGIKINEDSLACGLAVHTGEPVITPDVTQDPRWTNWRWLAERFNYRACWSFPIEINKEVIGNLAMYFRIPRQPAPQDHALAAVITRAAGIIIARSQEAEQRNQVKEALRLSEQNYRNLFDSMDQGFCLIEMIFEGQKPVDWIYLDVNPTFKRQVNFDPVGKKVSEVIANVEEFWLQFYGKVSQTAQADRAEERVESLDRWYSVYASRIGGNPNRLAVVFDDITERKRRDKNQELLAGLSEDFARLITPGEISQVVGEKLFSHYELSRLTFVYVEEQTGQVKVVFDRHAVDMASVLGDWPIADFVNPDYIHLFRSGQPIVINELMTSPLTAALREAYRPFGQGALLLTPLVSDGRWRFAIALHKANPYAWRADQIDLLNDIAPRLYLAMERQRMEELKRLTLLQQTEALAKIGSWEYIRQRERLIWSDGMYRLLEMEPGRPVQPEILLQGAIEEDIPKARRLIQFLQEGQGHFVVTLRIWVGEQVKTLHIQAEVIGEGNHQRVIGVDLDISDQLTAQQQLQETAEKLQAVLDGSPAAIGLLKPVRTSADADQFQDFQLTVGNRKLAYYFNQPLTKLLGQSGALFNQWLWDDQTLTMLRHVRLTGESQYKELLLPGDDRWLAIAVTRQNDDVLLTALDITEAKSVQQQAEFWLNEVESSRQSVETLQTLRESMIQRAELLRGVSHDLRGSLLVVNGSLDLMNMSNSEADRAQLMNMVVRNARQATGMLTELLDYSRLEAGQQQRAINSFDVTTLFQEISQNLQLTAGQQGLQMESFGVKNLVVEGDRLLVYRMAQNLAINAIKYTRKGVITIEWGNDAEQEQWWFSVTDTGPGLDPEMVAGLNTDGGYTGGGAELAKPFETVNLKDQRPGLAWTKLRGEGIGLRIVRQLAQLLEAHIQVNSELGVGTRFVVSFPVNY